VPWQKDNKVCFIRLEGRGFGGALIEFEMRLSVEDSPNSAGVVIDAIRCVKRALERGDAGPLVAPSAYYMKSPPQQLRDNIALEACNTFVDGHRFALLTEAAARGQSRLNSSGQARSCRR
jgi:myo-inositol-1-phosphate synthase